MSDEIVRTVIRNQAVPPGGPPLSPAVVAGNLVFASGNVGVDPSNGKIVPGGIEPETRQTMTNIISVLKSAGSDLERALKVTVYLADINDWPTFNEIYKTFFQGTDNYPARTAFQVAKLPMGARIEIEVVAARGKVIRGQQSNL